MTSKPRKEIYLDNVDKTYLVLSVNYNPTSFLIYMTLSKTLSVKR